MKFLYIAGEHVSGTLSLFQAEHRRRGDECRFVTFWHSHWDFPDDICLNLPFMPDKNWVRKLRRIAAEPYSVETVYARGQLPYWRPGVIGQAMFSVRDQLNWPRISRAIEEHHLHDFDIIVLDGGLDFTRDSRFVRVCRKRGAHIAAFYHGTDLRNRGIVRTADEQIELRMTSEWDLLEIDPRLEYVYLPFDTSQFPARDYHFHNPVRIAHASRNPFKGTAAVQKAVEELQKLYSIEARWFTNHSHNKVLSQMCEIDIFVDQLTNLGGWGYGMSAVEALAAGVAVITNIPPEMDSKLDDHPFVQADEHSVKTVLQRVLSDEAFCRERSRTGREWVVKRHDIRSVGDRLYGLYEDLGWLNPRSN